MSALAAFLLLPAALLLDRLLGEPRPVSIPSAAWGPWPPSWNESSAAVPTGHA